MSFYVSTLKHVPSDVLSYYIYVIDCQGGSKHTEWINTNLDVIGQKLGRAAGIVSGPDDFFSEVHGFLSENLGDDYYKIEPLLFASSCLIVANNVLAKNKGDVFIIPLTPEEEYSDESLHEYMDEVIGAIVNGISTGTLIRYLNDKAALKFKLKNTGSVKVDTLNQFVELKPNIAGIGINVNAMLERFFGR